MVDSETGKKLDVFLVTENTLVIYSLKTDPIDHVAMSEVCKVAPPPLRKVTTRSGLEQGADYESSPFMTMYATEDRW